MYIVFTNTYPRSLGYETLDLRPSGQPDVRVRDYSEVLETTLKCWQSLPTSLFQSAWVVCGYVEPSHFDGLGGRVFSMADATKILNPSGVFQACGIRSSPQRCQAYEWQIEDKPAQTLCFRKNWCCLTWKFPMNLND